jgi:hypothetical protein
MQSRHTIHLPCGSASNQVQPAPVQVEQRSFSEIALSLCAIGKAYIARVGCRRAGTAQAIGRAGDRYQ